MASMRQSSIQSLRDAEKTWQLSVLMPNLWAAAFFFVTVCGCNAAYNPIFSNCEYCKRNTMQVYCVHLWLHDGDAKVTHSSHETRINMGNILLRTVCAPTHLLVNVFPYLYAPVLTCIRSLVWPSEVTYQLMWVTSQVNLEVEVCHHCFHRGKEIACKGCANST